MSAPEADHSLLEVLATIPQFELMPRTSKFRAAFRLLDVDHSGCLDMSEVHGLLSWLVPEFAPTTAVLQQQQHTCQLNWMCECMQLLTAVLP